MKKLFALAAVVLGFTASSFAQSTATASTTATLVTPISIAKTTDMNFGTVAASNTSGTIVLDYINGTTSTGGSSVVTGGGVATAVFTVTGSLTESISVLLPATPIDLTGTTSGVTVGTFAADCGSSTNLEAGSKTIKVKAILNLPANVVAGTYSNASGLFVTVNYN